MSPTDVLLCVNESALEKALVQTIGEPFVLDYEVTWGENGLDELDLIEMIIKIEGNLNISIPDDLCELYFMPKCIPNKLPGFKAKRRDDRLNEILE